MSLMCHGSRCFCVCIMHPVYMNVCCWINASYEGTCLLFLLIYCFFLPHKFLASIHPSSYIQTPWAVFLHHENEKHESHTKRSREKESRMQTIVRMKSIAGERDIFPVRQWKTWHGFSLVRLASHPHLAHNSFTIHATSFRSHRCTNPTQ